MEQHTNHQRGDRRAGEQQEQPVPSLTEAAQRRDAVTLFSSHFPAPADLLFGS